MANLISFLVMIVCEKEREKKEKEEETGFQRFSFLSSSAWIFSMDRKLVVLGIPWEVDTEGLRKYMSNYGDLEDCIVMKERSTGRSRGFGYVTFASANDAKSVLSREHILGERLLEVKIATPKEEMKSPVKKVTRIFVARIPLSVDESTFQRHFEEYGEITDLYMPKDQVSKAHRGFGFITFASAGSVENLMADTHELGGATVVVDRATPKARQSTNLFSYPIPLGVSHIYSDICGDNTTEDDFKPINRMSQGGYGAYNAYISAATRYAAVGAPTLYDHPGPVYGRGESSRGMGKKIFVGRLSQEANVDDLRRYFGRFGRILDVYVPKDAKRSGHRGFGFVTFAEDGVADRVSHRSHEICGQQVAIDSATPVDDVGPRFMMNPVGPFRGFGGPMRSYGRMYGGLHFDDWSYAMGGARPLRADWRYRPY
ncbi:heterogeneous nuclear ribonucleoprotein A2-like protein 1-like isoform X2 [Gossypium australe]|uniref:Heterogeneous nuclear ribonucleoprotein A2-like protein 1-like isoform X2 n=1 Tax=Gossypium australe TaxID=47621 RepID=A0A5B6UUD6_9ROSI|nr:heterogeneous nuclear ribonucleoprotein A2-like protein 1-like isoform X2 [Gossypium australe]